MVNVVSQTNVIAFLAKNLDQLGRAAGKTATDLGLGKKAVISVDATTKAISGTFIPRHTPSTLYSCHTT